MNESAVALTSKDEIEVECEMICEQLLDTVKKGRVEHRKVMLKLLGTLHDMSERMVECIDLDDELYDDAMRGSEVVFDEDGVKS